MTVQRILGCNALGLALLILSTGCRTTGRSADGDKVYFLGTGAFHRKLNKLEITEEQARALLVAHLAANQKADSWSRSLVAIVGDSFLFSGPRKTTIDLRGYYVNAHTGQVTFHDDLSETRYVRPPFGTIIDYPTFK